MRDEPASEAELVIRWVRDVRAGRSTGPGPEPTFESELLLNVGAELISRWREPHRRYHTVTHLFAVLAGIDELAGYAEDISAVRLAAWFHDAIYQGRPGADEEDSARLAEQALPGLGWQLARVAEVARLVRLTADHAGIAEGDRNAAVLADADLAVLAAAEPDYLAYAGAIRAEYAHVPDDLFVEGRTAVLTGLLNSTSLYRTPAARERWTAAAEVNLRAEIVRLASAD